MGVNWGPAITNIGFFFACDLAKPCRLSLNNPLSVVYPGSLIASGNGRLLSGILQDDHREGGRGVEGVTASNGGDIGANLP